TTFTVASAQASAVISISTGAGFSRRNASHVLRNSAARLRVVIISPVVRPVRIPSSILSLFVHGAGRDTCNSIVRGNIACNYRSGRNYRVITDRHTFQDDRAGADPNVIANANRSRGERLRGNLLAG